MNTQSNLLCIASLVFIVGSANAAETPPQATILPVGDPVLAQAGVRIYKDPVTGEFKEPPAPETLPEQRMTSEPTATARERVPEKTRQLPDGGVAIELQPRFRSYSTATKGPDGKIKIDCDVERAPGS